MIQFLDILCAGLILYSFARLASNPRMWILHGISTCLFIFLMTYKGLYGQMIMGVAFLFIDCYNIYTLLINPRDDYD